MKTFSPMSKWEKEKQKRTVVEYINNKFNTIGGINKYSNGTNGDYFMRNVKDGINFYCKNIYLSKELRKDKHFDNFNFNKVEFADEGLEIKDEINEIVENVDDFIEGETIVYTPPSELPPPPSEWISDDSDTEDEDNVVEEPKSKLTFWEEKQLEEKGINPFTPWTKEWEDVERKLLDNAYKNAKVYTQEQYKEEQKLKKEKSVKKNKYEDTGVVRLSDFFPKFKCQGYDYNTIEQKCEKEYTGLWGDLFHKYDFIKEISEYYEINEKKLKKLMKINNPDFPYIRLTFNKKYTTCKIHYVKKCEELKSDNWKDKTKKYYLNFFETISCPMKENVWYNPDVIPSYMDYNGIYNSHIR